MRRNDPFIKRTKSRLVRAMLDAKEDDLDTVMRIEKTDSVLDPVMKTGRIDNVHDPTTRGVNDTARHIGTIEKTVNLPDQESTEKKRKDEDHITIESHHLDQNRVNLPGMAILSQDPGREMIEIDVQSGMTGTKETGHGMDMEIGSLALVLKTHSLKRRWQEDR